MWRLAIRNAIASAAKPATAFAWPLTNFWFGHTSPCQILLGVTGSGIGRKICSSYPNLAI
jgi:hypothetical protein